MIDFMKVTRWLAYRKNKDYFVWVYFNDSPDVVIIHETWRLE